MPATRRQRCVCLPLENGGAFALLPLFRNTKHVLRTLVARAPRTADGEDPAASALALYSRTLLASSAGGAGGGLARRLLGGWTGCAAPSLFSCPQFLAMGAYDLV